MHSAILILGSNIDPEKNILIGFKKLADRFRIEKTSQIFETAAEGNEGPNFLNAAIKIHTMFDLNKLKYEHLRCIEDEMGRVRTSDKNAPRTFDVDILIYDEQIIDNSLWERLYLAAPLFELESTLIHPKSGKSIFQIVEELKKHYYWIARTDISLI